MSHESSINHHAASSASRSTGRIANRLFARPKPWKLNLLLAASYSLQAIVASLILFIGYTFTDSLAVTWAIISAIIAIQPGLQQSLTASLTRIVANIVGALVGLGLGLAIGIGPWQVLVGIVVVVVLCQMLRLEDGLRIACIAVVIVLSMNIASSVVYSAVERSITVIAGCVVGTMVQFAAEALSRRLGIHDLLFAPAPLSANQEAQRHSDH
ncbi:MAG: FUSC family protein [Planctomycetes bacterium]|nr:FUSC family protein [Planctomycetota bacterium]